jgi:2-dehydro-3-deoxygluconokinase
MPLSIKNAEETLYDLVTLGECMVRLSPMGHGRIEYSTLLEVWVGGGEYNVSYSCSRLGLRTAWISRMVDNPVGRIILNHGRAVGVDMSHVKVVPYDGVGRDDRVGLNFTEVGTSVRPSVTMYDRAYSAASHMKPGDMDLDAVFLKDGARWLHTGGIFTALSEGCADVCAEALAAAHEAGAITSYDLNFRSKLWTSEQAIAATKKLMPHITCLIGNEEDFQKVLGFEVEGTDESLSELPVENYKRMVSRVAETYPNLKSIGTTLREVKSGLINNWAAILFHEGEFYHSRRYEDLEIEDRVGGGDGFATGMVYGFLNGFSPQEVVDFGAAHGALAQTTRGDTSQFTLDEVMHVMRGGSARIKR